MTILDTMLPAYEKLNHKIDAVIDLNLMQPASRWEQQIEFYAKAFDMLDRIKDWAVIASRCF